MSAPDLAASAPVAAPARQPLPVSIGRVASTVGLVIVLVIAVLMILPSLLGFHRYVITSGSMEPAIPTGAVVYDRDVPVADLEVGDVITFVPPPEYDIDTPVTHRIVEISAAPEDQREKATAGRMFRTKGDANEARDPWLMVLDQPTQDRVEHHVPYMGYVYQWLSRRWVQLLAIGLPALAIAVVIARALWREAGHAVRRERAARARKGAIVIGGGHA